MTTVRLTAAACALMLTACAHVRGNPAQPAAPLADAEERLGTDSTQPPAPSAEPPAKALPTSAGPTPEQRCVRGHMGEGVLHGIGATLQIAGKLCIVGGPFTLAVCGLVIYAYPGAAIGTLAGAAALGAVVGGLVGAAKCPSAPPRAAPPSEAPSSPPADPLPEPLPEPAPEPTAGPDVSWLPGRSGPVLG